MKKFLLIFATLWLVSLSAFAAEKMYPRSGALEPVSGGRYTLQGTTSQQVKDNTGVLIGVFVAQSTACTIKLWNNTAGSGAVLVDTFNAMAATWYPLPFVFGTGLYITVGGTCSYTVSYS